MTTRRLAALRVTLAIAHVLLGSVLLLPIAAIVGFGTLHTLTRLPFGLVLTGIVISAFPMWILLAGIRMFWRLTPRLVRALQVMDALLLVCALLLCGYGWTTHQAAEQSAARGGGLLGGYGVIPLALGILIGGLAALSLWLLPRTARTTLERGRATMEQARGPRPD